MALRNIVRLVHMAPPIKDLKGKKVLVTGAASGIGRATANLLAAHGAELVLTDINTEQLDAVSRHVTALGAKVIASRAFDVSDYDAVRAFADEVHAAAGALDIVMNVAGIAVWGTVENLTHEQWRKTVDVNLMGPIHVIETFVPPMIAAGRGGQLVNVSSTAGLIALPWHAAYSAAKFGLVGVSEVLRYDLRRHGIGVSVVVPGAVETGLVKTVEINGVDRTNPKVNKGIDAFPKVTAEKAAQAIVDGVLHNRFLVYTSLDTRFGYFWKRKFALPYEIAMRVANDRFAYLAKISERGH
ncbi:SDR family oxidoreductase [Tsukamurella ocularis]|uniref:SDR family oxidoreductase n=1 Tax=Tsukamurella ocularis TaxID=1970234 RepID=UPI002169A022|nr:SDR family oxidoreductase [Tsukamurella ocularis]MCS3781805.1 NAD(P)-dependent dehydrogenase (short-subunit alcohol dehydrogenase family) [Tsukamurella ocularis]MCS3788299.1 NAD(P)-dependent dehydrogenase (short-subunit alcohol dehydrogenase family) [Tsukamurella ocularis]MCS3852019.1 NAD(P)-dependent dehydrogenase (short-subunit alcohol dehydrogenase family) [Tsukamurella ocularis]